MFGTKIKEKAVILAGKNLKKILSSYPSARSHMSKREDSDDKDVADMVITSRFVALASICLEEPWPFFDKAYCEQILRFYCTLFEELANEYISGQTRNHNKNENIDQLETSELFKQMYYAKLEHDYNSRREVVDDVTFMIELYENIVSKISEDGTKESVQLTVKS